MPSDDKALTLPSRFRQAGADAAIEHWLQDEVAPVYDAMKANPERKLSAKSVFTEARDRYKAKRKARR